jgi:hypothetical protein
VGIFVAADLQFEKEQESLLRTLKNYAHRHGYDFFLVDPPMSQPVDCLPISSTNTAPCACFSIVFLLDTPYL